LDPKELTIAALLHDIGKVMYRGLAEAQKHKVPHQQLGYMWARKKALPEPVQEAIRRHHDVPHGHARYEQLSPHAYGGPIDVRNLLYLVGEADNIAAGMERDEYTEGAFDPSVPLANIFSDVQLEGRPQAPRTSWPLRYDENPSHGIALNIAEREALWRALEADLSRIVPNPEPSTLLYFLQKHLSQFPEHSWVGAEPPATSLYSHLKSTAAVALATYRYFEESGVDWTRDQCARIRDRNEERFALVGADLSGVQRFVYRVPSRKALRLLRARSFFLELLCESMANQLLAAAGLDRPNIVYIGGGGFVILAPNTDMAKNEMRGVIDRVNEWLWSSFGPVLYVAWGFVPTSGNALRENLARAWDSLHRAIAEVKAAKWRGKLGTLFTPRPARAHECDGCRTDTDQITETEDGELRLCPFCASMLKLGADLPEIKELWEVPESEGTIIKLPGVGYSTHGPGRAVYLLADLWRDLPESYASVPVRLLPTAGLVTDKETTSLAEGALGTPRIGVLRMDVDNLGTIFAQGLKRRTFARISDLSERLNLYFRHVLPDRLSSFFAQQSVLGEVERKLEINVVYAGGDDLFVLGPWDQMLDLAFFVNRDFRTFTGENPSITISGGLAVVDYRTAIQKAAGLAGDQESLAKRLGRDRLGIWGGALRWEERDKIAPVLEALRDKEAVHGYRLEFSRSILYNLKVLLRSEDEFLLPKVYYVLRAAEARKLFEPVLSGLREFWLRVAFEIADLASRGGARD